MGGSMTAAIVYDKKTNIKHDDCLNEHKIRQVKIGKNTYNVISVFEGKKTSSELFYEAVVKKILYDM